MLLTCFFKKSQQGWVISTGKWCGREKCLPFACDSMQQAMGTVRWEWVGLEEQRMQGPWDDRWGRLSFQQSITAEAKWREVMFTGYGAFPRKGVQGKGGGFKAASSPQWKAGSVYAVMAAGGESIGGTRLWQLLVAQHPCSWTWAC